MAPEEARVSDRHGWRPGDDWPWDDEAPALAAGQGALVLVRRSRRSGARLAFFRVDGELRYVKLRTWVGHAEDGETPRGRRSATQL
jgi:hypothetical protein